MVLTTSGDEPYSGLVLLIRVRPERVIDNRFCNFIGVDLIGPLRQLLFNFLCTTEFLSEPLNRQRCETSFAGWIGIICVTHTANLTVKGIRLSDADVSSSGRWRLGTTQTPTAYSGQRLLPEFLDVLGLNCGVWRGGLTRKIENGPNFEGLGRAVL